uniref:Uncharacterized protein n=1 Tax=Panagrolaimus superbus TaxID=310955 RepID=A0A914Y2C0_9BILA
MCAAGEFACIVSEQCISSGARCNGVVECDDGTDESNCEGCGQGFFHCLKSSECVPISQRCDGTPQCTHGEGK